MGGKSGCFTIQNAFISEKWTAIKRLRKSDTQIAQGVSEAEEDQGQNFGEGKMCSQGQFG
jgi:hypothetical protein